ncbi:SpoIIE family protein phosphatase [Polyangium sp. y55x31]|uniref:SpoIIE family protein phosphatase n=1 Tax=Polyangium sp. y55x31 TaxID=3042688 RepID=UPI00248278A1|nr:SpoIIE family protein phosphatase [Polyangium sp. y55x31]MDI1479705.1 SpoIIE family protein phosphatase [Polyangium sp. y55x31]
MSKFNTKFILVTGVSVLLGAILNVLVARQGIHKLSRESTNEIEQGLDQAYREYLTNHLRDTAQHTNSSLAHAYTDLEILADIVQSMVDHDEDLTPLYEQAKTLPFLQDKLVFHEKGGWYENQNDEPTAVAAWGYLGDKEKRVLLPEAQRDIDRTILLDVVMPSFKNRGADKLQIYFVGPPKHPYVRLAPWADMAAEFDRTSPGHNDKNFYEFFFTGLTQGWEAWIKDPGGLEKHKSQVTFWPPYDDASGQGGKIMTIFHPVWTKDRKALAGALGLDLTLTQIVKYIQDVKLKETGFAFLTQSDGNVLAVSEEGAKRLGLQAKAERQGLEYLKRVLKDSNEPQIASIELPKDTKVQYRDNVQIAGEPHILVLQRLAPFNMGGGGDKIVEDTWTIGFVIPKSEIYASLTKAQAAIDTSRTSIQTSQAFVSFGSILVLMAGVFLVSRKMTGALVALSEGATRMRQGDYGVRVAVTSEDEIGQLTGAFNEMAAEIQAHTNNLEELVKARTGELEDANKEIMSLNAQLAQENLRLGAELNVARQLQLMVLPPAQELQEIKDLDIAGYMSPADEVGGDYYDVLRGNGVIKIGIGDVTGHGLESGVLMLMVQTAVRTLLASNETDPTRFLGIVNKVIYQNIQRISSDKNLTLSLMDYSDGKLRLTGQHEEVIVVRASGELERVDTTGLGLPVGMDEDITDFLSNTEIDLASGDVVVLFTDGVTEAERTDTAQYGVERLCEIVSQNHKKTSQEIKDAIIEDLMNHIGTNKVYDDITVLVIKRL